MFGGELSTKFHCDCVVKITTTQVAIRAMANDASLLLLEASNGHCSLGVAEIDKGDDSLLFFGQITLAEETIVVGDSGALIDHSEASEASDIASVHQSLSLCVRSI